MSTLICTKLSKSHNSSSLYSNKHPKTAANSSLFSNLLFVVHFFILITFTKLSLVAISLRILHVVLHDKP